MILKLKEIHDAGYIVKRKKNQILIRIMWVFCKEWKEMNYMWLNYRQPTKCKFLWVDKKYHHFK